MALAPPNKLKQLAEGKGEAPDPKKKYVIQTGDEPSYGKVLLWGKHGSGKTYALVPLLLAGEKIFVLTTDCGGDGLNTVRAEMRYLGKADLLKNLINVSLEDYGDVEVFLKAPEKVWPEIYDFNPDWLVHDGWSNWQQYHLASYVEDDPDLITQQGAFDTMKYWGKIKTNTGRHLNRFLSLHNKKTGKLWHKMITCLEQEVAPTEELAKAVDDKERRKIPKDSKAPMIQGNALKLIGPAVDVYIRTMKKYHKGEDGKPVVEYLYQTQGGEKVDVKVRGLHLDPVMPADFGKVWELMKEYYGIKLGAVSQEVKEVEGA